MPKGVYTRRTEPWNKGRNGVYSEKSIALNRQKHLGKTLSEEHKKKISLSNKGKKNSPEHNEKIRKAFAGEKSHFWKGGRCKLNELIRSSNTYNKWRVNIFKRDNWTCQECKKKGYVEAHHIIPLSLILDVYKIKTVEEAIFDCPLIWDYKNGISLCEKCHKNQESHLLLKNKKEE